jgi:hypothetical protein
MKMMSISQRALDLITPLVGDAFDALPLECVDRPERRYYVLSIIDLVDCLDVERSEIEWAERLSGKKFIDWGYRYAFKPGSTDGHHLFGVKDEPLAGVLASQDFRRIVEENQLVGLDFFPADEYLPLNCTPSHMRERREREQKQRRKSSR